MNFAKDFPEKLRSSILVSEIVGKKVRLKKRGKDYLGLCPFHNEKTPSFTVNDQKGFYHCFGCQAHGDIITFVMETERLEFKDTIFKIAQDFGIEVPIVENSKAENNYVARDFEIIAKINEFFAKNLHQQNVLEARDYLKKRGFNSIIAKRFHLGYAPNSYEALTNYLKGLGFNDNEIGSCGVIGKNDKGKLYDKFRNRITFAITDKKNRPIAFGGRSLGDDMPKYLNSAETDIFKKNLTLYNFFNARKSIFDKGFAIMVEGYMDTISLAVNGFENVVAGLGTAIGEEHLKQLFAITDKIVICLDGDNAGYKAMKRVCEIALPLINSQKNILFCFLPNQMDPDDFVKKYGVSEFQKALDASIPMSQAIIDFTVNDLGIKNYLKLSAEEKARLDLELNKKINLINDSASKKYFMQFVKDWLFSIGRTIANKSSKIAVSKVIINQKNLQKFNKNSIIIMAFLIKFPQLVNYRDNDFNLREMQFEDEKMTELKEFILNLVDENCQNIVEELDKSDFRLYNSEIKNIVARQNSNDSNLHKKFRLLLLKDLFSNVERQYLENLNAIDDIETHQTTISTQKITEIFDYKNTIHAKIIELEKDII
ncbi:MAG: DNA primase [Alphaproteobacteria bacterium]|nr:DNA primase [Alphaproteobacteria bacterium]